MDVEVVVVGVIVVVVDAEVFLVVAVDVLN